MSSAKSLTTGAVAKYCGVNLKTVLRWIERGELNAYKLPGNRRDNRIESSAFLAFLKKNALPIPRELEAYDRRILIVDDEIEMAKSIQRTLRAKGYETQIADDGFKAGAMLERFRPSLITLDLRMPGVSGLAVIRFIRYNPEYFPIKILVFSAMPQDALEEAKIAGADDALSKGASKDELVKRIMRLFEA